MATVREKRKRRHNKGRFALVFRLLCVLALFCALFFGATVFFRVEQIVVTGNNRYTQEEIIKATGIQKRDNLFHMDKYQIIEDMERKLPYLEEVTLRRTLPNTITIQVTEWAAAAQIETAGTKAPESKVNEKETPEEKQAAQGETANPEQSADQSEPEEKPAADGSESTDQSGEVSQTEPEGSPATEAWLVSVGGKLLEPAGDRKGLISVTGLTLLDPETGMRMAVPQEEQSKLKCLLTLLGTLDKAGSIEKVQWIDLSKSIYLVMRYENRFDVKLPLEDDMSRCVAVLLQVVKTREDYDAGTVDLTEKGYAAIFTPE